MKQVHANGRMTADIVSADMQSVIPFVCEQLKSDHSVRFFPHGVSMLPMLRQGLDTVTLSPLPKRLKKYDIPLYRRPNGQYVLHRIVKVGETYTCIGDNQFVFEADVAHEQMIAVVSGFSRAGKEHTVNEWGYRIYCRFWHYSRFFRRVFRAIRRRAVRLCRILLRKK